MGTVYVSWLPESVTMPEVSPRDIQGQHHLNGHIRDWGAEGLNIFSHLLSVSLGVLGASIRSTRRSSGAL